MIIDGNKVANSLLDQLQQEINKLQEKPCVALLQVGEDVPSSIYIARKQKIATRLGIKTIIHKLPKLIQESAILDLIEELNQDKTVHGILIQCPLPSHLNAQRLFNSLDPSKDVDGFHALNLGKLCQEDPSGFVACTPLGIRFLIEHLNIPTQGKKVVILGRSLIVGKPTGLLFLQKYPFANATVSFCHSQTKNIAEITQTADILIAAIGQPGFVTADMVKKQAVVIDVGINRVQGLQNSYKIVGDVDFESVKNKTSAITPVPGGIGPLTVAMLMHNTLKAYLHKKI